MRTSLYHKTKLALVGLLAATLCGAPLAAIPAGAADEVHTGYMPLLSFAPLFVAQEKGFFAEQNLTLKLSRFADAGKQMAPLATGELEVASGSPSAGLYNAIASGQNFRIVADKGQAKKGFAFLPLVVRKDLYDSGKVRSVADIKGLIIGQVAKGSASEYNLYRMAKKAGLNFTELTQRYLEPPKQYQALKNKALDVLSTVEPWGTRSVIDGDAVLLATAEYWLDRPVFQIAVIMFSGKFMKERNDAAQRWVDAYVKGINFLQKHGWTSPEIDPMLQKWTKVPPPIIAKAIPPYFAPDGRVDKESLVLAQEFYFEQGLVKKKISMDVAVDMRYIR
ncbi:MAG: ABC transporter substrate-binding protein [Candidatus Tectomicrobia bacterium]|nr:ABC transporter substrate-binding protein [Candidatus Tectomicrobia bacterium]